MLVGGAELGRPEHCQALLQKGLGHVRIGDELDRPGIELLFGAGQVQGEGVAVFEGLEVVGVVVDGRRNPRLAAKVREERRTADRES